MLEYNCVRRERDENDYDPDREFTQKEMDDYLERYYENDRDTESDSERDNE